jgi:hypothetical protein
MPAPGGVIRLESQDFPAPDVYAIAAPVAAIKTIIKTNDFKRVGFIINSFRYDFVEQGLRTLPHYLHFSPGPPKRNSKKCKKIGARFYISFTLKSGCCGIMFEKRRNEIVAGSHSHDFVCHHNVPSYVFKIAVGSRSAGDQ